MLGVLGIAIKEIVEIMERVRYPFLREPYFSLFFLF